MSSLTRAPHKLLELGLLDFVDKLKSRKESRLFPELNKQRDGYSQAASKWFGRLKDGRGLKGKTFHSFRHTFANTLKQEDVEKEKVAALMGHKDDSMTFGRYGKPYESSVLKEVVEKLLFFEEFGIHITGF